MNDRYQDAQSARNRMYRDAAESCINRPIDKTEQGEASPASQYFAGKDAISRQMRGEDLPNNPATTAFGEILRRIHTHTGRVHKTTDVLEEIGTRIMGSIPQETIEKDSVNISPDGTLDHTLLALNRLDTIFARLEAATMRLELL